MQNLPDFITQRLTDSPQAGEWLSFIISAKKFNSMDLINMVKSHGFLCQTISAQHLEAMSPQQMINIADTFVKLGVVVLLVCNSQAELNPLIPELQSWQDRAMSMQPSGTIAKLGRLFVLLNNTPKENLDPVLQQLADYTCVVE